MHESLDPNDDRNFLFIKTMKSDEVPVFYRNHVVCYIIISLCLPIIYKHVFLKTKHYFSYF
uniref:Ovule protein n=1 Tax=Heterorhabditis bacteriophora TaxID=37862 RepID=A0A1I7WMV6_HETBA